MCKVDQKIRNSHGPHFKFNLLIRKESHSYETESEVAQSCPTLSDPMDGSLLGSSVHGIFQVRVLEWIAISFSRGSSQPRGRTWISRIPGRCFTIWATREAHEMESGVLTPQTNTT